MAIEKVVSVSAGPGSVASGAGKEGFARALEAAGRGAPLSGENAPRRIQPEGVAIPGQAQVKSISSVRAESAVATNAAHALDHVARAQQKLDQVLRVAQSGKTFTAAELLALQANVYRASQELDLAGKVVEKATAGVKQILQTQI